MICRLFGAIVCLHAAATYPGHPSAAYTRTAAQRGLGHLLVAGVPTIQTRHVRGLETCRGTCTKAQGGWGQSCGDRGRVRDRQRDGPQGANGHTLCLKGFVGGQIPTLAAQTLASLMPPDYSLGVCGHAGGGGWGSWWDRQLRFADWALERVGGRIGVVVALVLAPIATANSAVSWGKGGAW